MADTQTEVEKFLAATKGTSTTPDEPTPQTPNGNAEAEKFLSATGSASVGRIGDSAPQLVLPLSQQIVAQVGSFPVTGLPQRQAFDQQATAQEAADEQAYIQRNAQPGVPLDVRSGIDTLNRLRLGLTRNKQNQLEVLRNMYGAESIRLDQEGNFIVRDNRDGKPVDVLVDERKFNFSDFADMSSEALPMVASIFATKGIPVQEIFKSALRGAAAYAGTATANDAVTSLAESQGVDIGEILSERGKGMITDTVFGYGLGKGINAAGMLPKLARLASSSLSDTTREVAMAEVEGGRRAVSERFGITMEPTVAELTGSPMALRLESFLSNIPLARNTILKKWQLQIDNEKAVQNAFLGGQAPDPQRTGKELIGLLGGELKRSEEIASKAASIVRQQGQDAITEPLESISGRPISPFQFGSRMIRRGEAQLQSFKKKAGEKFDALRAQPDTGRPLFDAAPIKARAQKLRDELTKDVSGDTVKPLAPSGVTSILESIDNLLDQQSYFDLVKLRDAIYDRIDSPEPISSRGTRMLKGLGAEITEQMKAQGKTKLSPQTQALAKDANQFYADNVETFYQKGVLDMLKPRTEAGAINPELVASRLVAGGKGSVTTYNTLREFFEKEGAVKDMNRLLRDRIIEGGTDSTTGLIKVEDLASTVSKMEPEIVSELFRQPKDKLLEAFRVGQIAKGGMAVRVPGEQSGVVAEEFQKLASEGKLTGPAMRTLMQRSLDLRRQYGNSIRRAVKENDFGVIEAAPETFAKEYLFNPKVPLADVKDAMQSVYRSGNTELIEDVRRSYLAEIFNESAKSSKGDVAQLVARVKGSPLRDLDPQAFAIRLQDQATQKRISEILGPDGLNDLKNFALSIGGRSLRDAAGSTVGAFVGGSMFEKLLNGLGGLSELPKYVALSWLTTSPKTISFLRSAEKLSPVDMGQAVKAAVLTPEFMRVLTADSRSPEDAHNAALELKRWAAEGQGSQPSQPTR